MNASTIYNANDIVYCYLIWEIKIEAQGLREGDAADESEDAPEGSNH